MKNGKVWYIQMLQTVFSSSVCPYNLLFRIQHPQKGGGGLRMLVWCRKAQSLTKKRPFLAFFFMRNDKCWCIRML